MPADGDMEWLQFGVVKCLIDVESATERLIRYSMMQRSLPARGSGKCRYARHAMSEAECLGGGSAISMNATAQENMSWFKHLSDTYSKAISNLEA